MPYRVIITRIIEDEGIQANFDEANYRSSAVLAERDRLINSGKLVMSRNSTLTGKNTVTDVIVNDWASKEDFDNFIKFKETHATPLPSRVKNTASEHIVGNI